MTTLKKNILTWFLYDTGNSPLTTALGGLFLAQWIVLDKGFDDIWYGGTFVASTIIVLILSPALGAWSDKIGVRMPFIKWITYLMYALTGILVFSMNLFSNSSNIVFFVLFLFLLLQTLYQFSLIFYNALLEKISNSKNRGYITGVGDMCGQIGWMVFLLISLLFTEGKVVLPGSPGRTQVFLPAFLMFIALSTPMLLAFRETTASTTSKKTNIKEVTVVTIKKIRDLFQKERNIGIFLLGFCFVSDALLTSQLYFAIVGGALFGVNDKTKTLLLMAMSIFNIIGSYLFGKLVDIFGTKRILVFSSISLAAVFGMFFLVPYNPVIYIIPVFGGLGWGGVYVASRALLVKLAPPQNLGEYFGLYSTFQKFASIVGPILWGATTLLLKDYGSIKYRAAGTVMLLLIIIGTILLKNVREPAEVEII